MRGVTDASLTKKVKAILNRSTHKVSFHLKGAARAETTERFVVLPNPKAHGGE